MKFYFFLLLSSLQHSCPLPSALKRVPVLITKIGQEPDLIDKQRFKTVCLYTVDRGENHPSKPDSYRSPDSLWRKFGFQKHSSCLVYFYWQDLGDLVETEKPMNVWIKQL